MALTFSTEMAQITGNAGGAVQSLPGVNLAGARERTFIAHVALAAQAAGSQIAVARIPLQAVITGIQVITDTSLGSATIQLGDAATPAAYAAAQTLTSTQTPTRLGVTATHGTPIVTGYDAVSGASAPYEDIILTTAAAALPASGNLLLIFEYALD